MVYTEFKLFVGGLSWDTTAETLKVREQDIVVFLPTISISYQYQPKKPLFFVGADQHHGVTAHLMKGNATPDYVVSVGHAV